MKKEISYSPRHLTFTLGLAILLLLAVAAWGDAGKAMEGESMEGSSMSAIGEEEMAAWMKAMTPGEHHEQLAKFAGTWNCETTMWMDPSQPPTVSQATSERTMVLGGRYLQEKFTGDFNGMPMEGMGLTAFDNVSGKFVSTWIDNFSTGVMVSHGKPTPKGHTLHGEMTNPMTGGTEKMRMVNELDGSDHNIFTMYTTPSTGGGEHKQMVLDCTRK